MLLRLVHESPLNVPYDHVYSNLVFDASWHDDVCLDLDLDPAKDAACIADLL